VAFAPAAEGPAHLPEARSALKSIAAAQRAFPRQAAQAARLEWREATDREGQAKRRPEFPQAGAVPATTEAEKQRSREAEGASTQLE
jgi:hypothetical protein